MSVERLQILQNGQEVEINDLNLLADAGGLADDHVLAELLRPDVFTGGSVAKAILPFGQTPTVTPAGATGSVTVAPFRAIVGSRDTAAAVGPLKNWNDVRSAIFTGPGTLWASLGLQPNPEPVARFDLVYAQLQIDQPGAQVSRYRKDPSTEQVTVVQVAKSLVQTLTVSVLGGIPQHPKPRLPPDGGGTYFFPLAYVRVHPNFGPLSSVAPSDIQELLPHLPLSPTTGASTLAPANHQHQEGGTVMSSSGFGWGADRQRPSLFLPPSMTGCEGRLVAIDLLDKASAANWSHPSGGIVDDSRDWRHRLWRWQAAFTGYAPWVFPWEPNAPVPAKTIISAVSDQTPAVTRATGMGQSFVSDTPMLAPPRSDPAAVVALLDSRNAGLPPKVYAALVVDLTSGALKVFVEGAPGIRAFFWLDASGQFPNF